MPKSPPSSTPRRHFERTRDPCPRLEDDEAVLNKLERRLGRLHAKLRLGIEMDHEAQIFGQGINFFHIENWVFGPFCHSDDAEVDGIVLAWPQECGADPGQT
jgi:hypothetical protein